MQLLTPAISEFVLLFAFIVPAILFLFTQQKTLQIIQPDNRLMNPGMVWLQCIPLFGLIWQFVVVTRISNSIAKEFSSWNDESAAVLPPAEIVNELGKRPTYQIGIAYSIIITTGIISKFFSLPADTETGIAAWDLAGIICWIVYWVRLVQYKRKLKRRYL